jgi:hypothetical protein
MFPEISPLQLARIDPGSNGKTDPADRFHDGEPGSVPEGNLPVFPFRVPEYPADFSGVNSSGWVTLK